MRLAEYLAQIAMLRRTDPVLAQAWLDALTAALMARHEPGSLTERALEASWTSR